MNNVGEPLVRSGDSLTKWSCRPTKLSEIKPCSKNDMPQYNGCNGNHTEQGFESDSGFDAPRHYVNEVALTTMFRFRTVGIEPSVGVGLQRGLMDPKPKWAQAVEFTPNPTN